MTLKVNIKLLQTLNSVKMKEENMVISKRQKKKNCNKVTGSGDYRTTHFQHVTTFTYKKETRKKHIFLQGKNSYFTGQFTFTHTLTHTRQLCKYHNNKNNNPTFTRANRYKVKQ